MPLNDQAAEADGQRGVKEKSAPWRKVQQGNVVIVYITGRDAIVNSINQLQLHVNVITILLPTHLRSHRRAMKFVTVSTM